LAVNGCEVARPLASLVAFELTPPPAKVPDGPEAGAVNVTTMPLTGNPFEVTMATSGVPNGPFTE
jgi:hypothetical protein